MWGVLREIQGYIGLCLCKKGRVVNGACAGVSRERYDEYLYVWIYWGGFRETGMQCVVQQHTSVCNICMRVCVCVCVCVCIRTCMC